MSLSYSADPYSGDLHALHILAFTMHLHTNLPVSSEGLVQATLVLIRGLALEPLLELIAAGKPLSGSSHPFADEEAWQKVHDLLGSWWHHANEAHAPVLMAWAVFAALATSASEGAHGLPCLLYPLLC